ncbi:MAG: Casein kinase II subunit alpha [Chaenotheca gracillima]|nr:MAG: Casein kinase II subunit alpha [Chaenotheca gracillima]
MFYDLNVPWAPGDSTGLQRTLAFLHELGYDCIALNHTISGKLPSDVTCPIPKPLPFDIPTKTRLLRRCTLILSDPAQNHRLPALSAAYDLLAIRPANERALQQACQSLDVSLISLDLTVRHPYHFKQAFFRSAVSRGVRFEISYAPGILATDQTARRNLISNATQLIRATRGKGIVLSSEAPRTVGIRAPFDVINLGAVWGLSQERGREAIEKEARAVVVTADMKRTSWRGVIDVVDGGMAIHSKRKADAGAEQQLGQALPNKSEGLSKKQAKRARAEKAKLEKTGPKVEIAASSTGKALAGDKMEMEAG